MFASPLELEPSGNPAFNLEKSLLYTLSFIITIFLNRESFYMIHSVRPSVGSFRILGSNTIRKVPAIQLPI